MKWLPTDTILITVSAAKDAGAIIDKLHLAEDEFKSRPISVAYAKERNERRLKEMEARGIVKSLLKGRGTTGRQVFGEKGVTNGEVAKLIRDAVKLGFQFADASWHEEPLWDRQNGMIAIDRDGQTGLEMVVVKTTIDFVFERKPDTEPLDDEFLVDVIKFFKWRSFRYVHVWKNPTGVDAVELCCGTDPEVGKLHRLRLNATLDYTVEETPNKRLAKRRSAA